MAKPSLDFQQIQQAFTDAIRDPENCAIEVETRRLKIYQDLFFNNIESFIAGTFPVLKEIINKDDWQVLIRDFFVQHSSESPYFLKISEEFLRYLEDSTLDFLPAFTQQLAHWEWMELFADVYVDEQPCSPVANLDFNAGIYQAINTAWPLAYEYPVHKLSCELQPQTITPVFLLVHRNSELKVGFIELNPLSYLLFLALTQNSTQTLNQLLETIALEHSMERQSVLAGGQLILSQWCELGLITRIH